MTCPTCKREICNGELITGLTWNGDEGQHITCPITVDGVLGVLPDTPAPDGAYIPDFEEDEMERARR
jgi:hypothetical protein